MDKKTVRQLRNEKGLSREQLAVVLGISFPTLVRIEGGKAAPRINVALRIATFFGVSVEDIEWGERLAEAA